MDLQGDITKVVKKRKAVDLQGNITKGVKKRKAVKKKRANWEDLQRDITEVVKNILAGRSVTGEDYIKLYSTIYNLCIQKIKDNSKNNSEQLYDLYCQYLDNYIISTALPSLREKHHEFVLRDLMKRLAEYKLLLKCLSHYFSYLDRYFVPRTSRLPLKKFGLSRFRELAFNENKGKLINVAISLIDREREGALLKNSLDFFVEIGSGAMMDCYENNFEVAMLEDSVAFYSRKASAWIVSDSCPDYTLKTDACLMLEKERASHYLYSSREPKLLERVQHELISVHANQLLAKEHSGCHALLRDGKVDDLSRMYRLFYKIEKGLEPVSQIFKQHVAAQGTALVKQAEDAAARADKGGEKKDTHEWVFFTSVIELHDKYMEYVNYCFENNSLLNKALKEAFEGFCNKNIAGCSIAELLATFCDSILQKGGNEKLSDEAIEGTLEKVVILLTYISDKDLFAEFSRKKLARRLLFDRSANADHERCILSKLKQQFGNQFTSNMEGMLNDMSLSKENQASFEEYLHSNPHANPRIGFTVSVLTTGSWPSYKFSELNLPVELAKCVEAFGEFYQTKTRSRKLTWIYSLGSCIISCTFENKIMELIVTTQQACGVMLFNDTDRLSFFEITSQLNLTNVVVVRLLHSLSCGKYKILNKEPNTKSISPTDCFEFNSKFTDRSRRIKIPLPLTDAKKKVIEDVDKDRRYAIDACIVCIMKSRKVLSIQQLMTESVEQLSQC